MPLLRERRLHAGSSRVSCGNSAHGRMVQDSKVPAVVDEGIAHSEGSCAYITGNMHPVGIVVASLRRSNMDMNVRTV
jgi:hypothetical protein